MPLKTPPRDEGLPQTSFHFASPVKQSPSASTSSLYYTRSNSSALGSIKQRISLNSANQEHSTPPSGSTTGIYESDTSLVSNLSAQSAPVGTCHSPATNCNDVSDSAFVSDVSITSQASISTPNMSQRVPSRLSSGENSLRPSRLNVDVSPGVEATSDEGADFNDHSVHTPIVNLSRENKVFYEYQL